MITMQEILYKTRALLDEYTDNGVITNDVEDIEAKCILFADMAQKELYKTARIEKTFSITNYPYVNLLGNFNFNQKEFTGTDVITDGKVGAKAYHVEVSDECTFYLDEFDGSTWNVLITQVVPSLSEYTTYKGLVTPTDANYPIRFRMSGTTYYRYRNVCLFSEPFKANKIPDYKPWYPVTLPNDFMDISSIVKEYPEIQYEVDGYYKWERPNKLYLNYFYNGEYRLIYRPIPITVTSVNSVLECNEIIAQAIPYYCAANIAPYENKSLVSTMWQKYQELKNESNSPTPMTWETIKPTYSMGV